MRRAVRTVASGVAKRSDMDEGVENDFSVPLANWTEPLMSSRYSLGVRAHACRALFWFADECNFGAH